MKGPFLSPLKREEEPPAAGTSACPAEKGATLTVSAQ